MSLVKELWEFLKVRKKFWLAPIMTGAGDIVGIHNSGDNFAGLGSPNLSDFLETIGGAGLKPARF